MTSQIECPECGSEDLLFNEKRGEHVCKDCMHAFKVEQPFVALRVFVSYGHDEYAALAERLRGDLQKRGHEVWFDLERLKPGGDWEAYIEEGIAWVSKETPRGRVVLVMTPHSVRRPDGYCLNEIARALANRLTVVPVMVVWCEPPLSICRIQWLDMQDCWPVQEREERYEAKRDRLVEALEHGHVDFEGVQARLRAVLDPLPFDADIAQHIERFTGRQWVFDRIDAWLGDASASRVFWLVGSPGTGKTAIAAWLCTHRREVAAFHLCRHGHVQKADPRRVVSSLAYQLSTQLQEYATRLSALDLKRLVAESDAKTLFDALLVQPLAGGFAQPDRTVVVVIDALDEATAAGRNELAAFIATEFDKTPDWLRLVITSRPDPEVTHPLQGLTPYRLDTTLPENEADLREFLARELSPYGEGGVVPGPAMDEIAARSEGVFLYAEWVRQELAGGRLSLDRLEKFPQGLGGVYAEFFHRQVPEVSAYEERVLPALEAIAASRQPIDVEMLSSMLGWDERARLRFRRSLGSLYTPEEGAIRPFHRSLTDWLTDPDKADLYYVSVREGHRRLAEYLWQEHQGGVAAMSAYGLRHLPAHLTAAGLSAELVELLTDLEYLDARAEAGEVFDLATDFSAAGQALPPEDPWTRNLRLLEGALRSDVQFIARHPSMLFQCLWNRAWWHDCPKAEKHHHPPEGGWGSAGPPWERPEPRLCTLLERWRQEKASREPGFPWLRSARPPSHPLGRAQLACLRGHERVVRSVAWDSAGGRIVSGSEDRSVRVWDAATGQELACLYGHEHAVTGVVWDDAGRRIVSGSWDKTVRVWDATTGQELACLRGHERGVNSVAWDGAGGRIVSSSDDQTVRVWDAATGQELACLRGHRGAVWSVAWDDAVPWIASGCKDRTVRVWDAKTGRELACLCGHEDAVTSVAWDGAGGRIISGSWDKTVRVWDAATGQELACLRGHEDAVRSVAWDATRGRIASAGDYRDKTVRVWDATTGQELACLRGHEDVVRSAAWDGAGGRIASGSDDSTVRVWDAAVGQALGGLGGHEDAVTSAAWDGAGRRIVSGSWDKTVRVWDAATGQELACLRGHEQFVSSVAWDELGGRIVSGSYDKTVRVWDAATGECLEVIEGMGDVAATAGRPEEHLWRAVARNQETAIERADTGGEVVWWPMRLVGIATRPDGRAWGGGCGSYLAIFVLEGEPGAAKGKTGGRGTVRPAGV